MSTLSVVPAAAGPAGAVIDLPAEIRLVEPLPGLPGHDRFTLTPLDDAGVLFALRSAVGGDDPVGAAGVRLFVVPPQIFFPDYTPTIDPAVLAAIGAEDHVPAILAVVRPSGDDGPPTVNLLAPLVVDALTGQAAQAVLDEPWPLRAPLS